MRQTNIFLMALLLLVAGTMRTAAQGSRKFAVAEFRLDPFDLTAKNDQYKKIDGNGAHYAIIKVTSDRADDDLAAYRFNFGNMNHEVAVREGELWVYVQRNAKMVTISRPGYATISRYDLKTTIEEGKTYAMRLALEPEKVYTQMVMFAVTPADCRATVMVKGTAEDAVEDVVGITDETGATAKGLLYGSYTYRVVAEGYYPTNGQFTLNNLAETHTERVALKPRYGTVTLRTGSDADIYVNGEMKGRRTWTGRLNGGSYSVECRQDNHRPSTTVVEVKENEQRTVDLPAPTPITGMLSLLSTPLGASVTIDGQSQGTTPRQIPQMVIGRHTLAMTKSGYETATQTFEIKENETTTLNIDLKKSVGSVMKGTSTVGTMKMVAAGKSHFLIVKSDGSLWACGYNNFGQLGDGTTTYRSTPVKVMDGVASVAAGSSHSLIVKTDGSLWACGYNKFGQLGDGTTTNRSTPVKVMDGVASVAVGFNHSLIVKSDGSLWACGYNYYGQLGVGITKNRVTPVKVMDGVASVAAGDNHSLIVKTDGSLWACGYNNLGQLGDETTTIRETPVKIMDGVASVAAGFNHSLIVKTDGSLWACGDNSDGQLGDGTTTERKTPVKVMDGVASVAAGSGHSLIVKTDGSLWACGYNNFGQLGDGTTASKKKPVKIMKGVASVAAGWSHSLIVKTDGSLWACGGNKSTPVKIMDGVGVAQ